MELIKPGLFGRSYTADTRRRVFDFHNHQILSQNKPVDFVFIGDSITEYWDVNAYFNNSVFTVNRGVGGDISEIVKRRFTADVIQLKPCKVICLVGCNDLMGMHDDLWWKIAGKDMNLIKEEYLKNIHCIIEMCNGIELYICSVLPSKLCVPYDAYAFNRAIKDINGELVQVCKKLNVKYVDYHSVMCEKDGLTVMDGLTYDGIHPTPDGYKIMADTLMNIIPELKP